MLYNNKEISKLGLGLMRLPMLDKEVDIEKTKEMVDLLIENGFTYFDTAYGYHDQKSEIVAKKVLVERYPRESFQLTTKLPAWFGAKNEAEAQQMFYTSLERTGVEYFDFFLLHNLGGKRTRLFDDYHIWDFLTEQKKLGKIKKLGFSMHDTADALETILQAHSDVDFVQLQINYADWNNVTIQSKKCYEVARKYGKEIIIMEPIRGGLLANPPKEVAEILKAADKDQSFASWALRYAASLDGIITVLSGMSNIEQVTENISFMKDFKPLTESEKNTIQKAQEAMAKIPSIPCTSCYYCVKDCPCAIPIPDMLGSMNKKLIYNDIPSAKGSYAFFSNLNGVKASACIKCGLCESVCPQKISIISELETIVKELEAN